MKVPRETAGGQTSQFVAEAKAGGRRKRRGEETSMQHLEPAEPSESPRVITDRQAGSSKAPKLGPGTYVSPVDRLIPARNAETAHYLLATGGIPFKKCSGDSRATERTEHGIESVMGQASDLFCEEQQCR